MFTHIAQYPEGYIISLSILVFLGIVFIKGRQTILKSLDARIATVRSELDNARELHDSAKALLAKYEKKRHGAKSEAEEIIKNGQNVANKLVAEATSDLNVLVENRLRVTVENIRMLEVKAVQSVRDQIINISVKAAEQILADNLTEETHKTLVSSSIDEASAKLHWS